ncbi:RNA-binding S4 domain-containing protein, partial [Staphylococcus epidermidis]|uniref:RNA-binding S4 domain-containing protein n=1 Tax=Staphylococcus epidermidis TaxID=1282 RepID=UPI0021B4C5B8
MTLPQFLKTQPIIQSRPQAKSFLQHFHVLINPQPQTRPPKKLQHNHPIHITHIPQHT